VIGHSAIRALFARGRRLLPIVLCAIGLAAIGGLVAEAGASTVLGAFVSAGPWLVALVFLEIAAAAADAFAVRSLHGARGADVPTSAWLRGASLAVACACFLPGGRVLGEVARATAIAPWVGRGRAAAMVIRAHGTYLLTISFSSFACFAFVVHAASPSPVLEGLVLWSGGFTGALGTFFLLGPRWGRVGTWLGRRFGLLEELGPCFDAALSEGSVLRAGPLGLYLVARFAHLLQSLTLLLAIGGFFTLDHVFISEGIQLVAANTGDAVPGQAGVLEGAYRLFAAPLGLGGAVALAVTIALLVRATRVIVGGVGAALATLCVQVPRTGLSSFVVLLVALTALAAPSLAAAQPSDEADKLVVRQRAVGVINPMGAEHMVSIGARFDLGLPDDPLMADTHLEVGLSAYTSPVYSMTGGYLQLSPLAFLVLRAEVTAMTLWSIGMDGAGYYPVEDYDADVRSQNLPGALGRVASGFNAQLSAILQGAVQLGPWRPIFWSQLTVEHERLGEEDFHYSPKYDLVLARSDWMLASSTMAMLELALSDRLGVRLGAYDDLRFVLASGALSHQLGATAMVAFDNPGSCFRELLLFGRAGVYTDPERRAGQATGLVGLIVRYDVADL